MALQAGRLTVVCMVLFTTCQTSVHGQAEQNILFKNEFSGPTEKRRSGHPFYSGVHNQAERTLLLKDEFSGPKEGRRSIQTFYFSLPFSTLVRKTEKRVKENSEDNSPPDVISNTDDTMARYGASM